MKSFTNLLETYKNGFSKLSRGIEGISPETIDYIPEYKDAWSIKEHVIHVVDSELNGFVRLKSIIAQPGSDCYVMEEEGWTRNLRRKNEDMRKYLHLFGLIREMAYDFIVEEPESTWNDLYFIRTYKGQTLQITIEKWIETYVNHLDFHIDYIQKILQSIRANGTE